MVLDYEAEKKFIIDFIKDTKDRISLVELKPIVRSLVTAFAYHQDIEVDTHKWDWLMWDIYYARDFGVSFKSLDNYMARFLV